MGKTIVKSCSCKNDYQDSVYGNGRRLFNLKKDTTKGSVCTVCGKAGPGAGNSDEVVKKVAKKK